MARKLMLTNTAIEAMADGETLNDTQVPGLHVRRRGDKRTFFLYFRTKAGQERRPKMGDVGIIAIGDVRTNAREMLSAVASGRDPMRERTQERGDPLVNDLWDKAEKDHYNKGRQWDKDAKRLYDAHARPRIGRHQVRTVRYSDIVGVHTALKATPIEANRTLAVLSKLFHLAERYEWRDPGSNPCRSVPRFPELKRRRFAKPDELGKIGALIDKYAAAHPRGAAFLYALLFSGARPSEIERAKKSQLERFKVGDAEWGVLRIDYGKRGQRDVFLPPQALSRIDALPAKGDSLIGCKSPRRLWLKVRKEAGCEDLWARDSRRTFVVTGLSNGQQAGLMGELLGQKSAQTTKIYSALIETNAVAAAGDVAGRIEAMLNGSALPST